MRNLDFGFETSLLECRIEDFTQRDFKPIHQVRDRPLIVVDGEVDETAVYELFIRNRWLGCIEVGLARIIRQPFLPVIRTLLIERHIQTVIGYFTGMHELDSLLMLEILLELLSGACAQTFVIFRVPVRGNDLPGKLFLPCLELAVIVEEDFLCPATGFQDRRIHEPYETGNLREGRPLYLEEVDAETLNVCAV